MRHVNKIIIHCSATKEGKDFRAKDINEWHIQRGFKSIGYHFVVDIDGTVEKGRDLEIVGAHCYGYNTDSIGVCYIGGLDEKSKAKDTRNAKQKESLTNLITKLVSDMQKLGNNKITIYGHHDFNKNKECPCFDAKEEYKGLNIDI